MLAGIRVTLTNDEYIEFARHEDDTTTVTSNLRAGLDEDYMREWNAAVDGLEAGLLAAWSAGCFDGMKVETFRDMLQTAVDAIANHIPE